MAKNYYEILGVDNKASQADIKSAYRKLAKLYHPDLHPNDESCAQKFKEINEAYEVLGDANKRSNYDQFGSADGQSFFGGGAGSGFGNHFGSGSFSGFEDIFDIFNRIKETEFEINSFNCNIDNVFIAKSNINNFKNICFSKLRENI
ncbi:MAG: J domain-containing protein, partial [Clostridia bacterium]|nr:J domain-containing protein [Clostridia bacterium]